MDGTTPLAPRRSASELERGECLRKRPWSGLRLACRLPVALSALLAVLLLPDTAESQIFGRDGLFKREPQAPRAPTRDEIGVPVPVAGKAQVPKGQEVQFEIRAETNTPGAAVEFLIRKFPSAGKIISLTSNPSARNRAIVTYYADPESGAESDVFAFAARYRGGRYSAEMRYDIDLVGGTGGSGGGSDIVATSEVDFGEVMVGSEKVVEISVRNLGSEPFSSQVFLQPPWHLVEPRSGQISLHPRQGTSVKVAFRPQMIGETSYYLSFSRSSQGTSKLSGSGADPFSVADEAVELVIDESDHRRTGEIELVNHGDRPLKVNTRASSRLEGTLEEAYLVPPDASLPVRVALEATDVSPLDGMVQFSLDNGYTKTVRVFAPVVPPRLELAVVNGISNEIVNYGQIEAGRSTQRSITVTNRGGVAVPLEFHVPEPFRLVTDPGPQLMPLSSINLALELAPPASQRGPVDVTMNVYGSDQTLPLRLLANVVKPSGAAASQVPTEPRNFGTLKGLRLGGGGSAAPSPAAAAGEAATATDGAPAAASEPELGAPRPSGIAVEDRPGSRRGVGRGSAPSEDQDFFEPMDLFDRELNPDLRSPEDLTVLAATSGSVTLAWTAPSNSELENFVVESPAIGVFPEDGALPQRIWVPRNVAKSERIGRLVKARIRNLTPSSAHEFRVVTVDQEGRASPPSETIVANTTLPMDWTYVYLALALAALGAFGWAVRKILRDRQGEVYQPQNLDA